MKIFGIDFSKLTSSSTSESDDFSLLKFKKGNKEKGIKNVDINKKSVEVKSKDLDEWEIIDKDYSSTSKKSALLPLLDHVAEKYPENKELYFAVSTFYDNNYNFTNRTSFTKMKDELSKKLEKICDTKTTKTVVQEFERLVKEGNKE